MLKPMSVIWALPPGVAGRIHTRGETHVRDIQRASLARRGVDAVAGHVCLHRIAHALKGLIRPHDERADRGRARRYHVCREYRERRREADRHASSHALAHQLDLRLGRRVRHVAVELDSLKLGSGGLR